MVTAIKHTVSDGVKPWFVIFGIRALWRSVVKIYKWRPGSYTPSAESYLPVASIQIYIGCRAVAKFYLETKTRAQMK